MSKPKMSSGRSSAVDAAFAEMRAAKKSYKDLLKVQGKKAVGTMFESFFQAHPDVIGVTWDQYTPYFNDGDACTFSVNEPAVVFKAEAGGEEDEDDDDWEGYGARPDDLKEYFGHKCAAVSLDSSEKKAWEKDLGLIYERIQEFDDVMLATFGDHVSVIASRKGFEVNEQDHD